NFGSGMTGGLAYVIRTEVEDVLHRDFVNPVELESKEEAWVRRVLEEHVHFTGSPRAIRLLARRGPLPLVRVQPVHSQASVEATWQLVLGNLKQPVRAVEAAEAPLAARVHA